MNKPMAKEDDLGHSSGGDRVLGTKLSFVDKQILKILLSPGGDVSSHSLEQTLRIPRSTIQRRRRHLENMYLEHPYSLNLAHLGYRRVDLLIFTGGGATQAIAHALLKHDLVLYGPLSILRHIWAQIVLLVFMLGSGTAVFSHYQRLDLLTAFVGAVSTEGIAKSGTVS